MLPLSKPWRMQLRTKSNSEMVLHATVVANVIQLLPTVLLLEFVNVEQFTAHSSALSTPSYTWSNLCHR